ncbi:MAG: hypothetical protein LBE92_15410 [Chryseobacterium sp.]|jgi:hypothetical protein|uniref:hypothetical protein n=1 Tax=Chryseobacterium sp. TaxID=1871047 RepID=UPI00283670FF|nr:hypothetical protein [Chryseobacterium sp.]MDR2237507.1 hypothetical protein [Chryseobacterium sp.]
MNPRVLELLKNPKNIQSEDLILLKEEIHAFPYVQNIRALHLYGVHLYDKENYQKELSTTAAYTTDKKILYQLINGKIRQESKPEPAEEKDTPKVAVKPVRFGYKDKAFPIRREESPEKAEEKQEEAAACLLNQPQEITHIYVNGERNRILFEGEENFLNDENTETIDLESTLESGVLVTQKTESVSKPVSLIEDPRQAESPEINEASEAGTRFTPEEIINDDQPSEVTAKEEINQEDHLSFHEVESLMPEVEIAPEVVVDEEVKSESKEHISEAQREESEETAAGSEFTPEEIIEEDYPSEEIDQENNTGFQELEPSTPEAETIHGDIADEEIKSELAEDTSADRTQEISAGSEFTPEKIVEEDPISEEADKEEINSEDNTGFHEVEALTPEANPEENRTSEDADTETVEPENDAAEISFHGTDSFMPDVKIQAAGTEETAVSGVVQPAINKHEEEMRRLIEEVEKKMKETKPAVETVQEETKTEPEAEAVPDHEISFAETQSFHFWSAGSDEPKLPEESTEGSAPETETVLPAENTDAVQPVEETGTETEPEINTAWKPMNLDAQLPDSMITKETAPKAVTEKAEEKPLQAADETPQEIKEEVLPVEATVTQAENGPETVEKVEETETVEEPIKEELSEENEAPVMSVSFFGSDISSWSGENKENKKEETVQNQEPEPAEPVAQDSNVPGFINTWQSWLKIDRTEEIEKEKTVIKEKAIETFIENNPRISQLKEESSYVVKERNDDISHLMTETLANLYLEQKLYSKAIKAFGILKKKHPEKADHFDAKIKEVNDIKSGK